MTGPTSTHPARSSDPLLQPFQLKHLRLKNRILSTSHEPAYSEDGMPKDRYRAYHVEKAKGGLAMTMTAGTPSSAPTVLPLGNLHAYDDDRAVDPPDDRRSERLRRDDPDRHLADAPAGDRRLRLCGTIAPV